MLNILTNLRPEAYPSGFEIFGLEIRFYAIIILGGAILCAIYAFLRFAKPMGMSNDTVLEGLALGLFFGILGGRIYYVIFNHEGIDNIWEALNPRGGGLAIHGAIIATTIFVTIYCKIKKMDLIKICEIVVPTFLMCQVIGRWGNFMNQEAFGPIIDTIGGLTIENIQAASIKGTGSYFNPYVLNDTVILAQREFMSKCLIPDFIVNQMYVESGWILLDGKEIYISGYYHPTFLYESLMNFAVVLFMNIGRKYIKKYYVGDSLGVYLLSYGVVRFIIESLRTDPLTIGNTGIKIAQVISILFVVGGILLLVLRRVFKYKLVSCYDALYAEGRTLNVEEKVEDKETNEE